jgi:hypothetical protein
LDAGTSARWATGDEVDGTDPGLRADLEDRRFRLRPRDRLCPAGADRSRADELAATVPKGGWQRLSAGPGPKGQRYYDWVWIALTGEHGQHWLLIRRPPRRGELAFYRCYCPTLVPLGELVRVAGRRWTIEESFQAAKGLAGLDEHQVRRWTSWRRWVLLAMLAHALLAVIAARKHAERPPRVGVIALTCNDIRHLIASLTTVHPNHSVTH